MYAQNPKKEVTVNFNESKVKEAILKLTTSEPNYYVLVKDDSILNEIRIHQKGRLLDLGYHIDFALTKISDEETKVLIEVSRNLGTINTSMEVQIAQNSLKTITSKFSSFLSGDVDPKTGKANVPQQGCVVFIFILSSLITGLVYTITKVCFS
jgi:hypothetical protein